MRLLWQVPWSGKAIALRSVSSGCLLWPAHKALCKLAEKQHEAVRQLGTDTGKFNDVMAWYGSVPGLHEGVMCSGWKQRHESPWFQVQGGVNARLATCKVFPRSSWERLSPPLDMGFHARFAQADFDPDIHFFLVIGAGHAGTADWPCPTPRMRFPAPPEEMDALVDALIQNRKDEGTAWKQPTRSCIKPASS